MARSNKSRKLVDKNLISIGTVMTVVLIVLGGLAWWAYSFTTSTVHDELAAQKITFPPKGSPALDPQEFPGLQKYAGQPVDNGPKAKAFANEYIAVHLKGIADGQTYAQVSAKALADPQNGQLQQQSNALFKGETLRGILLGDGYAFWTIGTIAKFAAIAAFAGAALMGLLVLLGLRHLVAL